MSESALDFQPTKFLRLPEVMARTCRKKSKVWESLNPRSPRFDPTFPKPIKIGDSQSRSTYWVETEIEKWLRTQIQKSREQDSARSPAIARMVAARVANMGKKSVKASNRRRRKSRTTERRPR
ncbi:MAG: AlpA family phage regulatory protein [Pseudomonadota bacterium]